MISLVSLTAWGLLVVTLLGALSGSRRWSVSTCAQKIMTSYLWVSFVIGLPVQISAANRKPNHWLGHLWVLATLVIMGQWIASRTKPRLLSRCTLPWAFGIFLWFLFAFLLGVVKYYPYVHLYMAVIGFSGLMCSRHATRVDKAFLAAFAAEIATVSIDLYWHGQYPIFWAARNVTWAIALRYVI